MTGMLSSTVVLLSKWPYLKLLALSVLSGVPDPLLLYNRKTGVAQRILYNFWRLPSSNAAISHRSKTRNTKSLTWKLQVVSDVSFWIHTRVFPYNISLTEKKWGRISLWKANQTRAEPCAKLIYGSKCKSYCGGRFGCGEICPAQTVWLSMVSHDMCRSNGNI